jgi:hypothetical protein
VRSAVDITQSVQMSAIQFQILNVPLCEVFLITSWVLSLPVPVLKLLIHVDDLIYSLGLSIVLRVVSIEFPK